MAQLKLSQLTPDSLNANLGTERGSQVLEKSISNFGTGRSILIDKKGRIIAGNKTAETAGQLGLDDVIVVPSDGTKLVAVQRNDLDLENDLQARELAYADNRTSELDLEWNTEQIEADLEAGVKLDKFFSNQEIETFLQSFEKKLDIDSGEEGETEYEYDDEVRPSHVRMVQLFYNEETIEEFNNCIEQLKPAYGTESVTDTVLIALKTICENTKS